jgi:sugar transferase (PEP-CTERM/EpsH1 system associated)
MRILIISPRQCWPVLSGAKLREYYLARAIGRQAPLTLIFYAEPRQSLPAPADLPFCAEIIPVPSPARYSTGRIIRGIAGRWPLPVENYTSRAMLAAIDAAIRRRRFDLIHLEGVHLAAYVEHLRKAAHPARITVDWHNIESEGMRRYARTIASLPKRAYAAMTARRLVAVERGLLRTTFGALVCSERERQQLLPVAPPGARIAVIENGVDVSYFEEPSPSGQLRDTLVFVGVMNYHANVDAIVPFARRVWPRIRRAFPGCRFVIVGANPVPAVLQLSGEPGIEVTGTVSDVRPYYRRALAAVVPLLTGMGTRLKILEAMAAGVPVVSTTIGAEGLATTPGKDILIADSDPEWLSALASLTDPVRRDTLIDAARQLVRSRYDWQILGDALCRTYQQWLQ